MARAFLLHQDALCMCMCVYVCVGYVCMHLCMHACVCACVRMFVYIKMRWWENLKTSAPSSIMYIPPPNTHTQTHTNPTDPAASRRAAPGLHRQRQRRGRRRRRLSPTGAGAPPLPRVVKPVVKSSPWSSPHPHTSARGFQRGQPFNHERPRRSRVCGSSGSIPRGRSGPATPRRLFGV